MLTLVGLMYFLVKLGDEIVPAAVKVQDSLKGAADSLLPATKEELVLESAESVLDIAAKIDTIRKSGSPELGESYDMVLLLTDPDVYAPFVTMEIENPALSDQSAEQAWRQTILQKADKQKMSDIAKKVLASPRIYRYLEFRLDYEAFLEEFVQHYLRGEPVSSLKRRYPLATPLFDKADNFVTKRETRIANQVATQMEKAGYNRYAGDIMWNGFFASHREARKQWVMTVNKIQEGERGE
ncbi:hypothetical protein NF212_11320 [Parasalinivibrio latis]|uniref:hypothetical protein n=1 Tax=Parasalinivibrio latis TaxID=2952610 RepID=UPI0030E312A4